MSNSRKHQVTYKVDDRQYGPATDGSRQ